jgi:hypothetical protein
MDGASLSSSEILPCSLGGIPGPRMDTYVPKMSELSVDRDV